MSEQFKSSPSGARHGGPKLASEKFGGGGECLSPAGPGAARRKLAWNRPMVRMMSTLEDTQSSPFNWPVNNEAIGYQIQS